MTNTADVPQCSLIDPVTWHRSFTSKEANISSIVAVVVQCLMIPFVIFFNGIILLLVAKFKDLHKPRFVALCLVSITDFLSGVVAQPLLVAKEIDHFRNQQVNCEQESAFYLSSFLLSSASLYQLVILTYERYVGITDPLHYPYRITASKLQAAAVANWMITIFFCVLLGTTTHPSKRNIIFVIIVILVAAALLCVFYWNIVIFQVLKIQEQDAGMLAQQQQINIPHEPSLSQHALKRKACTTVVYLVVAFGLNYFPIIISTFLVIYYGSDIRGPLYFAIHTWVCVCVHFNSLFSPLLYGFRTKEFRQFARKFFGLPPANDVAPQALGMEALPHPIIATDEAAQTGPTSGAVIPIPLSREGPATPIEG